jgi:hypothetical protein
MERGFQHANRRVTVPGEPISVLKPTMRQVLTERKPTVPWSIPSILPARRRRR